ncbi:Zn-dependent exopeptidase [Metschnikowia bicuspidata]|uniref:Zn-dependent exopeptidase n=1 Tax=Metschnikowia bicuspidata TaxID=27322 RepID=A0A4P9ZFI6_9ASCO|nr:Zn-dependent exopeptidase [Metschnikowia bicuspidata]
MKGLAVEKPTRVYKGIIFLVSVCPIHDIARPESYVENNGSFWRYIVFDSAFHTASAAKLSGMNQVDTQVHDDPPEVNATFPVVYEATEVVKINTYGVMFVSHGSSSLLKPLMLAAHQDVVPVQKDTVGDWKHPPFLGRFDGEYVWGRGASECKNLLTAIMEAMVLLRKDNFKPTRTVALAFGFDEEVSGPFGAAQIPRYLQKRFDKSSMYAVVDEGSTMLINPASQRLLALPGTREKGYRDIEVELITPGGHSSIPPEHMSIDIMAELERHIESDPFGPLFTPENPTFDFLQCLTTHAGDGMSWCLHRSILRYGLDRAANSNKLTKFLNNALPESVSLLTNNLIAIESNIQEVMKRFVSRVNAVACKFDLGLQLNDKTVLAATPNGNFKFRLRPLLVTVWKTLAGATRHIYEDVVFGNISQPVIVAPAVMTGNTYTCYCWDLSANIFRYTPILGDFSSWGIHR